MYKDAENPLEDMSRFNEMHLSRSAIRASGSAQHRLVWGRHSSILDFGVGEARRLLGTLGVIIRDTPFAGFSIITIITSICI